MLAPLLVTIAICGFVTKIGKRRGPIDRWKHRSLTVRRSFRCRNAGELFRHRLGENRQRQTGIYKLTNDSVQRRKLKGNNETLFREVRPRKLHRVRRRFRPKRLLQRSNGGRRVDTGSEFDLLPASLRESSTELQTGQILASREKPGSGVDRFRSLSLASTHHQKPVLRKMRGDRKKLSIGAIPNDQAALVRQRDRPMFPIVARTGDQTSSLQSLHVQRRVSLGSMP